MDDINTLIKVNIKESLEELEKIEKRIHNPWEISSAVKDSFVELEEINIDSQNKHQHIILKYIIEIRNVISMIEYSNTHAQIAADIQRYPKIARNSIIALQQKP